MRPAARKGSSGTTPAASQDDGYREAASRAFGDKDHSASTLCEALEAILVFIVSNIKRGDVWDRKQNLVYWRRLFIQLYRSDERDMDIFSMEYLARDLLANIRRVLDSCRPNVDDLWEVRTEVLWQAIEDACIDTYSVRDENDPDNFYHAVKSNGLQVFYDREGRHTEPAVLEKTSVTKILLEK